MAAPSYTTGLTDLKLAESADTWAEPTASGWIAGGAPSADSENFIQGAASFSKTFNATGVGGMMADYVSNAQPGTDGAFLVWLYWASPKTLAFYTDGGIRLIAGDLLNAFKGWKLSGKDIYIYGGWINLAVDPAFSNEYVAGSPTGVYRYVGAAFNNLDSITKGNPCLCDAIRFGRCEARFAGGEAANYATFAGFAAANDATAARWGLIQAIPGGYLWKGLITLGYGAVVDFRDANTMVLIDNTIKVSANFNKIEIRQATSRVDWTSISFLALGTVSKGRLQVVDNAGVNITGCSFTDMDTFIFLSNSTILSTTFRRCGIVTQNGAVFTGCIFDSASGAKALVVDDVSKVTDTKFISKGTGYALEGFSSAGNYSFTKLFFTGYAAVNGNTGNEAIHVLATSGVVNILVSGGDMPSVHTEGATVNVTASVTVTVRHVKSGKEPPYDPPEYVRCSIHKKSDMSEIMNKDADVPDDLNPGYYKASASYTATGVAAIIRAREKGWLPFETEGTITGGGLDVSAVWLPDPNYA